MNAFDLCQTEITIWQTNTWKQWEPGWAGASEETVRYYMDPRNFLNENDIFMFESLTYEKYQEEDVVERRLPIHLWQI